MEEFVETEFNEELNTIMTSSVEYHEFLAKLKEAILDEDDYQVNYDKKDPKKIIMIFIKKSGYYKLKRAFKIRIQLIDKEFIFNDKQKLKTAIFHVRGYSNFQPTPGGDGGTFDDTIDAFGSADSTEAGKNNSNDVIGTAHTRSIVRCISQLVDSGKVGAEEISRPAPKGEVAK